MAREKRNEGDRMKGGDVEGGTQGENKKGE